MDNYIHPKAQKAQNFASFVQNEPFDIKYSDINRSSSAPPRQEDDMQPWKLWGPPDTQDEIMRPFSRPVSQSPFNPGPFSVQASPRRRMVDLVQEDMPPAPMARRQYDDYSDMDDQHRMTMLLNSALEDSHPIARAASTPPVRMNLPADRDLDLTYAVKNMNMREPLFEHNVKDKRMAQSAMQPGFPRLERDYDYPRRPFEAESHGIHRPASAQGRIVNTGGYGPPPGFNKEPQDVVDPNLMQALQTLSAQGNLTPQQIQQIQMQLAITNNSQPPARPQSAWDHKKPSTKQQQPAPIRREFTPTSPTHRPKDPPKQEVSPTNDASPLRSHLLEEFRNNKNRKYEIKDIIGSIVEFSGDQHGSRFIQQKLETCSGEEKQLVFDEILPNCLQLMTDVFGNYVIQKFFEHGNAQQKQILSKRMETHVLELSLQMYGCRVVQKAFEHVPAERQNVLIQELKGHVLKCVKDQNGNHVIQKAVERVDPAHVKFIIEAFHGQVYALATHPYGCRVIQRIFEHCSEGETRPLLDELHRYCISLIQDQYGNYVIQHILERGKPGDKQFVISKVKGNVLNMSKHKFASNVVEKCVTFGTASDRNDIIEEVAATKQDGTTPLFVMMKDQFANYVVQKLLDVASEKERIMLVTKIKPQLPSLKKFTYGKHLISKVEKYINQYGIE